MAESEKDLTEDHKPDEEPRPEDAEETPAEETPAAEDAPSGEDAPAGDAAGEDAASEEPPEAGAASEPEQEPEAVEEPEAEPSAEEPPAEEPPAEKAPTPPAQPADELSPKERRRLERSRASGPPRPPRSGADRQAERQELRRKKAATRRRYRQSVAKRRPGQPGEGTPPAEREPGTRKVRTGTVVSSKPDKTITVRIEAARRHRAYEKIVRSSSTLHAHDERNEAAEGDVVRVIETRPVSRTKRWRLVEIVEKAR